MRAGRRKTAATRRSQEGRFQRRKAPLVRTDRAQANEFQRIHARISRPADRRAAKKSRSTCAKLACAAELRAISTRSATPASSCWCCRKLSRNSRFARVRITAPPILREATTPSRACALWGVMSQFRIKQPLVSRWPWRRMCSNSSVRLSRWAGLRRRRCAPACPSSPTSNGRKPFPSHPAPVAQNGAAALGRVAIQKPVLALAPDFRGLVLSFHKSFEFNYPATAGYVYRGTLVRRSRGRYRQPFPCQAGPPHQLLSKYFPGRGLSPAWKNRNIS